MQNFPNSLTTPDVIIPTVGMGATLVLWSDRQPFEVVRVSASGKTCWIKPVSSGIVSGSEQDGSAVYEFGEVDSASPEHRVFKSKNGGWKSSSGKVWLGVQQQYYDPHF